MRPSQVKAKDVMRTRVARLDPALPVDDAIRSLEEDGLRGAPVVDDSGRVVGVVSLTDLAAAKEAEARTPGSLRTEFYLAEATDELVDREADEMSRKEDYSPAALATGTVSDWMSAEVVSVAPSDSLELVCRRMSENGVHRVLVLEDARLAGIISSLDVVRWVASNG